MAEQTALILTTDGAAPNNQHADKREAAVGYVIEDDTESLIEDSEYLGQGPGYTNNVAEYQAIRLGAERICEEWDPKTIQLTIQSDSQLIVNQLNGDWDLNDQKMQENHSEVTDTLSAFSSWEATQVSETPNNAVSVADDLAGDAFDDKLLSQSDK